jgi:hypothetical protein
MASEEEIEENTLNKARNVYNNTRYLESKQSFIDAYDSKITPFLDQIKSLTKDEIQIYETELPYVLERQEYAVKLFNIFFDGILEIVKKYPSYEIAKEIKKKN